MRKTTLRKCILWLLPYSMGQIATGLVARADSAAGKALTSAGLSCVGMLIFLALLDLWRPEK